MDVQTQIPAGTLATTPAPEKLLEKEEVILSWEAPEAIKHSKGILWFIGAGILAMALVLYAFWTNSWTMAVAFIVLAGVYTLSHHREPGKMEVKVSSLGIQAGKRKIPYNQIKAFWIVYNPPEVKVLKLMTTDKFLGEITLQLDGQAPGPLREYLLKQVPEFEGKSESLIDVIIRRAKL